jgi:hypothetical protein
MEFLPLSAKFPASSRREFANAVARIVEIYAAADQSDKAAQWREKVKLLPPLAD